MASMFSGYVGCGDWTDVAVCDGGEIVGVCSAFFVWAVLSNGAAYFVYIVVQLDQYQRRLTSFSCHRLEFVGSQCINGKTFL